MKLLDRFLSYVAYDTQSAEDVVAYPSTDKQKVLLNALVSEMQGIGLTDVMMDEWGYVMATLPASEGCERKPVIGFIAHVDTSPDMSGNGIKPQIWENYDGTDIRLNEDLVMQVAEFPELTHFKGHTLITTDGTTLLGADDKAGVAEIMTAMEYLINHPEIKHGKIRVAFTPDEEVGRGVDFFDVTKFGAQFAYTVDGGFEGELEYENFNAASAKFAIQGANIHPGYAKNKMVNAVRIACEIDAMLPDSERPEYTEGYEGFYHITAMSGGVERADLSYILRDHDKAKFEARKEYVTRVADYLNGKYGSGTVMLSLKDQYYNMREQIEPHRVVVDIAKEAMRDAGVEPIVRPIRGGTDGARLSFMELPCPNIFAGGMNFHGKWEYISLNSMELAVQVIVNLAKLWAEQETNNK